MLPLLLGAGRMLLAGGARSATKGAITKTFKDKAIDAAKDKVVSVVKDKAKETKKRVSVKKLFAKTKDAGSKIKKGGGLILRKSSAIVKQSKGALVKTDGEKKTGDGKGGAIIKSNIREEILKELEEIKVDFIKVKEISTEKLLNQKQEDRQRYLESRKKKSDEQEKSLEEKKDTKKKKKLGITAPKVGLFDMIKNFLLNVLIGSLLNYALKFGPTIARMFKEVGEGLTNTWTALKFGIISLTTVFPRQIKFIAKLTAKIVGPPAKLIGKLLLKAGGIAANLFKKAGGVIFNLIKGPLASLVKRVGGEALEQGVKSAAKGAAKIAGKAAGAAGSALSSTARIVKRLKVFSKIFKRVPVVGALIGIGIDLALGEKLDRAVVGAIGATLGAGIGGAIGQGLIPIPGLGAFIGGTVGAGIGDWAAKEIYKNLTGRVAEADKEVPIEQRAYGGQVNVRGGSSRTLRRSTSIQSKPSGSSAVSPQTLEKAKGTLLKDEESAKRFGTLSSTYGAIPFIGEAMKLGLDISLGEKVTKPRTDAIAESIGSAIGIALKNDEFGVPGFNKRIIGQFSKNLTDWAKKKIFTDVKSQENQFGLAAKKKEEEKTKSGGTDGETPSTGGDPLDAADLKAIKGSSADKKAAAHLATLEASSPQHVADVYQVILNRAAKQSGGIAAVITAREQFSPYSAAIFGTSADSAAARKYGGLKLTKKELFELAGKPDGIEQLTKRFNAGNPKIAAQVLSDFETGGNLSQSAKKFVGGAQYFMGYATKVSGERRRPDGGNYFRDKYGGGDGIKRHKIPLLAMGGNHQVTSSMGMRNFALSPGMHMGVDIAGRRGEPLQAFTDGMVEATGYDGGYGNWVNWIDNKGIGHFYGHMDKPAYVRSGQKISKGTILGPLGNTGKSSGPHLHWEAATNPRDNGAPKSSVLSRFNPLSKYNKESPFGGSIQPDSSMATSSSDIASSPGAPGAPAEKPSASALNFAVLGDPAAKKGGGMGGGNGVIPTKGIWDTGPGFTIQGSKDEQGRPVVFSKGAAEAFAKMMKDSGGKVKASDVSSSKRSPEKNRAVGGAGRSLHMSGIAMDIHGSSNSWIRKNGKNYGWIANDYPGSHGGHFEFKGAGLAPSGTDLSAPDSGSSSGTPGTAPPPEEKPSAAALSFAVLGDPAIKKSVPNISETPSYNKSNQTFIMTQTPSTPPAQPSRTRSGGFGAIGAAADNVVNSYGMVSRHIISSSMYKI